MAEVDIAPLSSLDHPLDETCSDGECMTCGWRDCPNNEPLHYHHEGCPSRCKSMNYSVSIVEKDLFTTQNKMLCHQCNCVTTRAKHLALDVFTHYPWADVYVNRAQVNGGSWSSTGKKSVPGTFAIKEKDGFEITALFAQKYPGKSRFANDTKEMRLIWFREALSNLAKSVKKGTDIAFPYGIGCGSAGGHWPAYLKMIEDFAKESETNVIIFKLPEQKRN